jgi:hypothetical protein
LAIALGLGVYYLFGNRRTTAGAWFVLAIAVASTLVQVGTEMFGPIASAAPVRLLLGVAVGLPLGWVAGARIEPAVGRYLAHAAGLIVVVACLALCVGSAALLAFALLAAAALTVSVAAVLIATIAFERPRLGIRSLTQES